MSDLRFRIPDQLLLPWSPQRTVSAARAAEMLQVSADTILRMVESGELSGYQVRKVPRSPYRVYYDSVVKVAERIHQDAGVEKRF